MKTKLQDKVLLPTTLDLSQDKGEDGDAKKKFVLCAVMLHKGKSAYSGHYIAEAMNWSTGQWFEFNDAKVAQLKQASHSCDNGPGKSLEGAGSADAYNMYYVEESFLAQSVFGELRKTSTPKIPLYVEKVVVDMSTYFQDLTQ